MKISRTIAIATLLLSALVGCGSKAAIPETALPTAPLPYAEWQKIADPEEKFNPRTIRRLSKDDQSKAMKFMQKLR